MKTYILLAILSIWSVQVFAIDTVRINPDVEFVVTGTTNITFSLNSVKPTADPSTEVSAGKVYVPLDGPLPNVSSIFDEVKYFTEPGVTSLFDTVTETKSINFPLYLTTGSTEQFLYVAIQEGTSGYKIAKQYTGYTNVTNQTVPVTLSPKRICDQLTGGCTFATTTTTKSVDAYFFFSPSSGTALGTTVVPAATGGAFFEINLSNKVYAVSEVTPVITKIRPGDKRLIIEYTSNSGILNPDSVRVFNHDGAPVPTSPEPIQNYYGTPDDALVVTEFPYVNVGSITVNNLINNKVYIYSILFVDLYKFGTVLSLPQTETPLEIQELLKKQACFLLTAGFGEEHYVISYFRHFRDTVLTQSYLGRKFISVYYENAPKYALYIYQHDSLRAFIRGIGYSLYFIFNNFALILITFALLLTGIYLRKNKDKIKI